MAGLHASNRPPSSVHDARIDQHARDVDVLAIRRRLRRLAGCGNEQPRDERYHRRIVHPC
jgi:hypothetical protein